MKIEEMLKQQEKRGLKRNVIKAKMQSYDDYVKDDTSPRPYNTPNVLDLFGDGTDYVADIINISENDIKCSISTLGAEIIRDTTSTLYQNAIRDTISTMGSGVIRDTTSTMGLGIIRDRKIVEKTPHTGRPAKGNKYNYSDLSGNARKLVNEIAYRCVVIGGLITPNIEKMDFSKNTGVKIGAIKTTIARLKEKGVITYYEATKGRNSCWKFILSAEILEQYIRVIRGE